jgi:hypothetical protein
MTTRHTLARSLGITFVFAVGCFGSHGTEPGPGPGTTDDAGAPTADATPPPPVLRDASPTPVPVPPPGTTCGSLAEITVTTETIGRRPCTPGTYPGSALYGIDSVPDGLRLSIDTCPDADDDCRCAVTVLGGHAGLAGEIARPVGAVTATFAETGVLIEQQSSGCPMDDFSCVPTLVFAAMDGSLDAPPIDPASLDVYWGDAPERGPDCASTGFALTLTSWASGFPGPIGTEYTGVVEGVPQRMPENGVTFRAVRANVRACPDERVARTAAWTAWASHLAGG